MPGEPKNQFSLTRVALSTGGRAKSNFLSIMKSSVLHCGVSSIPALLLLALTLSGCETQPVSLNDSREVKPSHLLDQPADVATSLEQGGKILVTRDKGLAGSAGLLKLFVDGTPVATLSRYERYEVVLKEGDHLLGVTPNAGLFGISVRETAVAVKKGQTYYFRVGFDQSGPVIQRSAFTGGYSYRDLPTQ